MSGAQLSLPGFNTPARDVLFLAFLPDQAAIRGAIGATARLCDAQGVTGRALQPEHLHVTLHGLGCYDGIPKDVIVKATQAMSMLVEPTIEVVFDRAGSFRRSEGKLPLVLRSGKTLSSLVAFHGALGQAMARSGLRRIRRGFTPHMTLLYGDRSIEETAIEPVSWIASDVVLIHSKVRETKHTLLARWPLIAAA